MERLATGEEDLLDIYGYQKVLDELGYQEWSIKKYKTRFKV